MPLRQVQQYSSCDHSVFLHVIGISPLKVDGVNTICPAHRVQCERFVVLAAAAAADDDRVNDDVDTTSHLNAAG